MLETFITSRVRCKIVMLFARYPTHKSHIRGLAGRLDEDAANVYRELRRLEKVGFLSASKLRNTKVYTANLHFPLLKELQSIVFKSQKHRQHAWSLNNPKTDPVSGQ